MRPTALIARAALAALLLLSGASAQAETTPSQLPVVKAKPAAAPQAGATPPMASPPAAVELRRAPAAAPKPGERIKALSGVMRSRDGKTQEFGVSRKLRSIIRGKHRAAIAPQATKIGGDKISQITNTLEYPYSTIGMLGNGCTGALIGKRFVLTAGYCLYDFSGKKWYDNVDFWPAINGQTQPFGSVKWKNAWVPQGYVDSGSNLYDYGLIELERDIGDQIGWFGFGYDNAFPFKNVFLTGYPAGVADLTMWQARCKITKAEPAFLLFTCPTKKQIQGAGGAPIWVKGKDNKSWTIYGIHMGQEGKGYWANRIDQVLYETLLSWMTPKEEQPPIADTSAEEDEEEEEEEG